MKEFNSSEVRKSLINGFNNGKDLSVLSEGMEEVAEACYWEMSNGDDPTEVASDIAHFIGNWRFLRDWYQPDTICLFHVGRGGQFFNPGHLEFKGFDTINLVTENLFLNDDNEYYQENGELVGLTLEEAEKGIGTVAFDGAYNTWYAKYLSELDNEELELVLDDARTTEEKAKIRVAHGEELADVLVEMIESGDYED